MKVIAVIPTKNEEEGIKHVLDKLKPFIKDIIVVDHSSDNTPVIAKEMGAKVITEARKGYGRAYKTGFANLPSDADVVVLHKIYSSAREKEAREKKSSINGISLFEETNYPEYWFCNKLRNRQRRVPYRSGIY